MTMIRDGRNTFRARIDSDNKVYECEIFKETSRLDKYKIGETKILRERNTKYVKNKSGKR